MGMLKEFKEFAVKGNLVDIATAFVMGAAFGRVVTAFVDGIIMPMIGMLMGNVDFSTMKYVLKEAVPSIKRSDGSEVTKVIEEVSIKYGAFITTVVDFVVVAFVVFIIIKAINNMKKAKPAPASTVPTDDQKLLMEIRDLLKNK